MKKIKAKSVKDFKLRFFTHECRPAFFQIETSHALLTIPRIGEAVWLPPESYDGNDPYADNHKFRVLDVEYPYYDDLSKPILIDIIVHDVNNEEVDV